MDGGWWVAHSASLVAILGSLTGFIAPIGALFAAAFYAVQFYQTKTVQSWIRNRRKHKIVELKARIQQLEMLMAEDINN